MSRRKNLLQNRMNQEDLLIEHLDLTELCGDLVEDLKQSLKEKLPAKKLRQLAGDVRLRQIVGHYLACLENKDLKSAELWGEKIEQYCIPKVKDIQVGIGPAGGDDFSMERIVKLMNEIKNEERKEGGDNLLLTDKKDPYP